MTEEARNSQSSISNARRKAISLDKPRGEHGLSLNSLITYPTVEPQNEGNSADVNQSLQSLTNIEFEVIANAFGLDGKPRLMLDEVSQLLGITRNNILTIQDAALEKLRNNTTLKSILRGVPALTTQSADYSYKSRELAWIVGTLASDGKPESPPVLFGSKKLPELELKITGLLENIMIANVDRGHDLVEKLKSALRVWRRADGPFYLEREWGWILQDPAYLWGFLEGMFNTRGWVDSRTRHREIGFRTNFLNTADFLRKQLLRLGLTYPKLSFDKNRPEGVGGVVVYDAKDLREVALNMHSDVLQKEEKLQSVRELAIPVPRNHEVTDIELAEEWAKLRLTLGRTPTFNELRDLSSKNLTPYGPDVYGYHFGRQNGKRSFSQARTFLEQKSQTLSSNK